ncbi:hypothetical protein FRC00_001370 [Tulasnella sp. 408]|nr:hypothetical protein FRC00_001370 [Tulasnella sp. 408]
MYEHITPDEAAGFPEGSVPKIGGYLGEIDTSTEVKLTKARNDLLKYLVERWCKANNRQRVNHDQMQLDINDKVPKSRLPKATRPIEIERVLANGTVVVETVNREVVIPYTKITSMPTANFLEWLYHFADPQIPPENMFYFSAELRRAEEAGATMPVTVQVALARPSEPHEDPIAASDHVHRGSNPNQGPAPPKKRAKATKGSKAASRSDLSKTKSKQKKESRDRSRDDEDSEEAEDFVLPESDDLDDLSGADLASIPTVGSRKSQRIKSKGRSEVQEPRAAHDEADAPDEPPATVPAPKTHSRQELGSSIAQKEHHFLSSISIKAPALRLPGFYSLSPAVDPLDSSSASRDHPRLREKTIVVESADPALVSAVSEQVWTPLNDPKVPVPMATTLQRLCTRNPDYASDTFDTASIWVTEALTVLRQRNFLSAEKEACTATQIFSTLCRYIVFIGRQSGRVHDVQNLVDVAAEWGTVVVTLTYAVHTTQAALLRYPDSEPESPLTQSTAVSQLLLSFLKSLYKYISTREYAIEHVASGDFLFLDVAKPPCFALSQHNERWFCVHPNKEIESRIYRFLMNRLETNEDAFHDLAIIGQMELLAVICAAHSWKAREMGETDWISWMLYLNSCILREPPGDDGQISGTQQSSMRALDIERQSGSKETDAILFMQSTVSRGPHSQAPVPGSSTGGSAVPPPKDRPNDTSRTASPTLSTAVEKVISEPAKEGASTAARYSETLGEESASSLPSTVQAGPVELHSSPPLLGTTSTGPSSWTHGDKARLAINKKMRDVEFFLQDGTLQMRDSTTNNVLTDRQKKPKKDLPEFDRTLLYYRAEPSANTSQELARGVGSSSRGNIAKDKVIDNGTSI